MNSSYLLIFALLAVSINCQFYSINLNRTQYPIAQSLNSNQNTTNLCYFNNMVTLTPIALANSKTNFTGFSISGQTNKNVTNCRVPTKLTFVTSSKDTTPQSIKSTNTTDFSNLYVVDDVSGASYKLINSVVNNYTANLNLYVYHNDTGVDNRVQQILKLINTSASSLMATLVFGLFTLLF